MNERLRNPGLRGYGPSLAIGRMQAGRQAGVRKEENLFEILSPLSLLPFLPRVPVADALYPGRILRQLRGAIGDVPRWM